jgi:hypothetical protein
MTDLIKKAIAAKKESKQVEFKQSFDPNSERDWLEKIVRSVVAMANSGGGIIVFGVDDTGNPIRMDTSVITNLDPAKLTDKIHAYTHTQFTDFEVTTFMKDSILVAAVLIGEAKIPLVFVRPGTYNIVGEKRPGSAFSRGTVYFRHGTKSEPGTSDDIRQVVERRLEEVRHDWLDGVQKIVEAPVGSHIKVLPPEVRQSDSPEATLIRIVDDPTVPAYYREVVAVNPNQTHSFRRNDVIAELRKTLPDNMNINPYDILAIRKVYGIDERDDFFFRPKFGSPQYSGKFVNWVLEHYSNDIEFFSKTRAQLKKK